jgi:aminopeptidase C
MTHAMVISGVHLDVKTGKPIRYKVENSWGEGSGDKGYFVMTDAWFDQYVALLEFFGVIRERVYFAGSYIKSWYRRPLPQRSL